MKFSRTSRFAAPPERVIEILCDESFQLGLERAREGVAETEFVVVEQSDAGRVFELRSREYKRTMTGAIDRSGTVASRTRNEYDAAAGTIRWTYESGNSERIGLAGTWRFEAEGEGTRATHDVTIDVRIPMIGGRIAKYIAGEMEKSLADQDRQIVARLT